MGSAKSTSGVINFFMCLRMDPDAKNLDDPDRIEVIWVDQRKLPQEKYKEVGCESRQVFDIDISRVVTEYRAQILEDSKRESIYRAISTGNDKGSTVWKKRKSTCSVYSQYQSACVLHADRLIPYKRIQEYFREQLGIPVSEGSLYNFNQEAFCL